MLETQVADSRGSGPGLDHEIERGMGRGHPKLVWDTNFKAGCAAPTGVGRTGRRREGRRRGGHGGHSDHAYDDGAHDGDHQAQQAT